MGDIRGLAGVSNHNFPLEPMQSLSLVEEVLRGPQAVRHRGMPRSTMNSPNVDPGGYGSFISLLSLRPKRTTPGV